MLMNVTRAQNFIVVFAYHKSMKELGAVEGSGLVKRAITRGP